MKYGAEPQPRTIDQNRAMHLFFQRLSDKLNFAGLEMKDVLKGDIQIWWTPEAVKAYLWKPLQKAMFQKESTTELDKHEEITKIHEQLTHILAEKHFLEPVPFPNDPDKESAKSMLKGESVEYPEEIYQEPKL